MIQLHNASAAEFQSRLTCSRFTGGRPVPQALIAAIHGRK